MFFGNRAGNDISLINERFEFMRKRLSVVALLVCLCVLLMHPQVDGCTNLLVTKGASEDGSVMITYTCDGEFHPHLEYFPAADYQPGPEGTSRQHRSSPLLGLNRIGLKAGKDRGRSYQGDDRSGGRVWIQVNR